MNKLLFIATILSGLLLYSCTSTSTDTNSTTLYQITLRSSPDEGGSVSPADGEYEEGSTQEISATPNEGWRFIEWSGDFNGSNSTASITVDADKEIEAIFEKKEYALTITTEGEGTVSEQVITTKANDYEHGTVVELSANPATGWRFVEWQGALTGSLNPQQLTVDNPKDVTAVFEKKSYALTITTDGQGTVSEEVIQSKTTDYEYDSVVKLTANSGNGWRFVEWQGDITGTNNPVQLTIDDPKNVTAVFQKKSYAITINTTGQGTVSKDPDQQEYEYGTTVDLISSPSSGWNFDKWQGDITGTDNPVQLTVDGVKDITAVFVEQNQPLFYLATNGVTIKCENAQIGDSGTVNGIVYTKRNGGQIFTSNAETTCTSGISNMSEMFDWKRSFNADISHWDVSSVTTMANMFNDAHDFNQDLSHWDVSNTRDMSGMFENARIFNGNISSWDVSSVEDMRGMFYDAESFNKNIDSWDVSSVTDMAFMFYGARLFNNDLNSWNVSSVTNMYRMFLGAASFNGNISSWDVSSVTDMTSMFAGATNFNSDLSSWNVGKVESFKLMFNNAEAFNRSLNNWNISSTTNISGMFNGAKSFNSDLNNWDVSNLTSMREVFYRAHAFNGDISDWDVSNVQRIDDLFNFALSFNGDISGWDVSSVTNMSNMFAFAESFNADISNWDVSNVGDMGAMFQQAKVFDQDLSGWCVSNIPSYPSYFASGTLLQSSDLPEWGTCP